MARSSTRAALAAATLAALGGCAPSPTQPTCPPGTTYAPVQVDGQRLATYVCVPSGALSPATAPAPTASVPAAGACTSLAANGPFVPIVAKSAPPAPLAEALPADGSYVLVDASRVRALSVDAGDGAAPTVVRGALAVAGARLVLGIDAGAPESFLLTYASGGLTKVCAAAPGAFEAAFLPGPDERSYLAVLAWDAAAETLTLRIDELDLVWVRVT